MQWLWRMLSEEIDFIYILGKKKLLIGSVMFKNIKFGQTPKKIESLKIDSEKIDS